MTSIHHPVMRHMSRYKPTVAAPPAAALYSELSYRGSSINTNTAVADKTFAAQAIGAAATNRWVLVWVIVTPANGSSDLAGTSAVTIGGVTATSVANGSVTAGVAGSAGFSLFAANVPTGTTADIVVTPFTSGASVTFTRIGVYTVNTDYDLTDGANRLADSGTSITPQAPANSFVLVLSACTSPGNTDRAHSINQSFVEDEEVYAANGSNQPNNLAYSSLQTTGAFNASVASSWSAGGSEYARFSLYPGHP